MSDLVRRVIRVTPDQVIGPRRRRRARTPAAALYGAFEAANWVTEAGSPAYALSPNAPTQQGFGHFDRIAQGLKA